MRCHERSLSLIGVMIALVSRSNGITTKTLWQIKQPLLDYEYYSSFFLSSFTVPTLALRSTWVFSAYVDNSKCEVDTAFIGLQYGSYPVFAPLNETFPPFFHVHRSHFVTLYLETDASTLNYSVENPLPGNWFAVSALEYDSTKRIKQKGLGLECYFYLDVIHHVVSEEEIPVLAVGTEQLLMVEHGQNALFRFLSGESTYKYTVTISNCSLISCDNASCLTSEPCAVRLSTRSQAFPSLTDNDTNVVNCSVSNDSSSNCFLQVDQPVTSDWQYLMIEHLEHGNITINLLVLLEGCEWAHVEKQLKSSMSFDGSPSPHLVTQGPVAEQLNTRTFNQINAIDLLKFDKENAHILKLPLDKFEFNGSLEVKSDAGSGESLDAGTITNPTCLRLSDFGRFSEFLKVFSVVFQRRSGSLPMTNVLQIAEKKIVISAFSIEPLQDSGGTLKIETNILVNYLNETDQVVVVQLCLSKSRIPFSSGKLSCPSGAPLLETSNEPGKNASAKAYIPYPEYGLWFIALSVRCYSNDSKGTGDRISEPCRVQGVTVNNKISLSPCVDNKCGTDGSCREYYSGVLHFTSCYCYYGYRGYGCTDATYAESNSLQLTAILLLTLSNLFFLPAIIVCIYRRFFTEALVYFFTMFFSSFYHACDGENRYTICIMPYGVLSFCDFLGAIVSFWVTLVMMAQLPLQWTSFSYVLAILALAMGVNWDKQSLWTFLVPSVVAGIILIISWAFRCHQRHSCYPSRKRWVFFILPGVCLALAGLIIFAGFETEDNYQYTHSAWHMCIALCIVFLLPLRSELGTKDTDDSDLWDVRIKGPDDIALVDYLSSKEVVRTPNANDSPMQPPPPSSENVELDAANIGNIHLSEEHVIVSENGVQKLVKNGFV